MAKLELELKTSALTTNVYILKKGVPVFQELKFKNGKRTISLNKGLYEIRLAIWNSQPADASIKVSDSTGPQKSIPVVDFTIKVTQEQVNIGRYAEEGGRGFNV